MSNLEKVARELQVELGNLESVGRGIETAAAEWAACLRNALNGCGVSPDWVLPVGNEQYPSDMWYCATWHDLSGKLNDGYRHTGIDLNLDVAPWGDVDRGQPVFAIADGLVHNVGCSAGWLGVVVLMIEHDGRPLWVRYAHLDWQSVNVEPGDAVCAGDKLGVIGNYSNGDHLHFDMARNPFGWSYWRAKTVNWVDPVPVLKAHLDSEMVDGMLAKK